MSQVDFMREFLTVRDKDHDDGRGSVDCLWATLAARAVIHGRHVQFVFVPIQVNCPGMEPDHARVILNDELARLGTTPNKTESVTQSTRRTNS